MKISAFSCYEQKLGLFEVEIRLGSQSLLAETVYVPKMYVDGSDGEPSPELRGALISLWGKWQLVLSPTVVEEEWDRDEWVSFERLNPALPGYGLFVEAVVGALKSIDGTAMLFQLF